MLSSTVSIEHTSIPKSRVYLDMNGGCNLACPGCFEWMNIQPRRLQDHLSTEEMKEIIDFTQSHIQAAITYAGRGEPLMDTRFREIYDYTTKKGLENLIFTNGILIKDVDTAKTLLKGGSVIVKKNSVDPQIQNMLVGKKNMAHRIQNGIGNLLIAREQLGEEGIPFGSLTIDSYIGKDTVDELPNLLRYCREKQIIPYFESFIELGQDDETIQKMTLSQNELIALFESLQEIDREEFGIDTPIYPHMRTYGRRTCKNATKLSIRLNGEVFSCISRIKDPLGTIYDKNTITDSLADILQKKKEPCCICSKTTGNYGKSIRRTMVNNKCALDNEFDKDRR